MENISNLKNWQEVARGIYQYRISDDMHYEIHILRHTVSMDISEATASLYLAGDYEGTCHNYFQRDCLLDDWSVEHCLETARKDYEENVEDNE